MNFCWAQNKYVLFNVLWLTFLTTPFLAQTYTTHRQCYRLISVLFSANKIESGQCVHVMVWGTTGYDRKRETDCGMVRSAGRAGWGARDGPGSRSRSRSRSRSGAGLISSLPLRTHLAGQVTWADGLQARPVTGAGVGAAGCLITRSDGQVIMVTRRGAASLPPQPGSRASFDFCQPVNRREDMRNRVSFDEQRSRADLQ